MGGNGAEYKRIAEMPSRKNKPQTVGDVALKMYVWSYRCIQITMVLLGRLEIVDYFYF